MSKPTIDPAVFREVLGSYPTGVCVISAFSENEQPTGMVVGTFTSVSLDPPLVGFLPDKKSSSWPQIQQSGHFCVNVLGSDQQDVCRQLSSKGEDKFAGVEYELSPNRLPLITDAIAAIECQIHAVHDAGDHWFVLGRVISMEVKRHEDPMLFHRGRFGGFAALA